jgi:chromosome partitioning protein
MLPGTALVSSLACVSESLGWSRATVAGAPITSLDPSSSGARNYRQLAREVIAAHAPTLG